MSAHTTTARLSAIFGVLLCFLSLYSFGDQLIPQAPLNAGRSSMSAHSKKIVIIGGGIQGVSTAYFLTRHTHFNPEKHSIVLLEAGKIANGSSGKGGGFIASWATPKCLAPLSFKLHNELAKEHEGDKTWGHRNVYAAEIKLLARNLDSTESSMHDASETDRGERPSKLDWILPGSVEGYNEIGVPGDSGQVNPYMFTKTLAKLAAAKGASILTDSPVTVINYEHDSGAVRSVTYSSEGESRTIDASDVLVAAGPWTPRLLPQVSLKTPRGHSVIVKPTRPLSPYILFPDIKAAPDSNITKVLSPDIYPRPADGLHPFDTVYASGPDDYEVQLPENSESVALEEGKCNDVFMAEASVSREIHDGEIISKQVCYKPQIREHEEDEEVGPMVGSMGVQGLWLATGHDEWGIQNAPATGLVMSEMIFDGHATSADCSGLDPGLFLS